MKTKEELKKMVCDAIDARRDEIIAFADSVAAEPELGFKEVAFTTKPEVMKVGYELYKRMGFEEVGEKDGIVSMRMSLLRTE